MPSAFFLMNNQKVKAEQDKLDNSVSATLDDMFEEFVMIEKEEIDEKLNIDNSKEKLAKEEKVMTATESQLIVGQEMTATSQGKRVVRLEDFKIKRVIDKGSFGKVFLVVNTLDDKVYAMKRINKDILIEKG